MLNPPETLALEEAMPACLPRQCMEGDALAGPGDYAPKFTPGTEGGERAVTAVKYCDLAHETRNESSQPRVRDGCVY